MPHKTISNYIQIEEMFKRCQIDFMEKTGHCCYDRCKVREECEKLWDIKVCNNAEHDCEDRVVEEVIQRFNAIWELRI